MYRSEYFEKETLSHRRLHTAKHYPTVLTFQNYFAIQKVLLLKCKEPEKVQVDTRLLSPRKDRSNNRSQSSPNSVSASPAASHHIKVTTSTPNAMTVSVTAAQQISITTSSTPAVMAIAIGRPLSPADSSGSDTDPMLGSSSSSSAMRRLYFRGGRSTKGRAPGVPKVVVMGSSNTSTSEATINTSTDSASTLVTNITTTDTETCDSLDLTDLNGQSEPLLSSLDEPQTTSVSSQQSSSGEQSSTGFIPSSSDSPNNEISGRVKVKTSHPRQQHDEPQHYPHHRRHKTQSNKEYDSDAIEVATSDPTSLTHLSNYENIDLAPNDNNVQTPQTAPILSHTRFPFDTRPPSPPTSVRTFEKGKPLFTFEHKTTKEFCRHSQDSSGRKRSENRVCYVGTPLKFTENIAIELDEKKPKRDGIMVMVSGDRIQHANINSASPMEKFTQQKRAKAGPIADCTRFPFDKEEINYERIQRECFAVEEETQFSFNFDQTIANRKSFSETDSADEFESSMTISTPSKNVKHDDCVRKKEYDQCDVFQQYTLFAQQEEKREKRSNKRNKNDRKLRQDAFTPSFKEPSPSLSSSSSSTATAGGGGGGDLRVLKFDQISLKFDKIPPKQAAVQHHSRHLYHSSTDSMIAIGSKESSQLVADCSRSTGTTTATTSTNTASTSSSRASTVTAVTTATSGDDLTLASCQKASAAGVIAGPINVTPNPMDTAVCTQPRATIVVQQPSLSLDNTVETFLLKNEGDYISVEQTKVEITANTARKKKQHEENMRQLLDVTNTLTSQEIKDFEMRYGSPHHSRSQSVKTPGSRASGRPNQLCLPQQRSRVASMPNTGVEEEYYRLRHFSITGKGVVNRGDSLKSRRSRSNNSVASSNSSTEHLTPNVPAVGCGGGSARTSTTCSLASSRESSTSNPCAGPFRVLMLGGAAVGKSSLVSQFMTSEYLHAYDTSIDDESGEKSVSVLLSGEESELVFIDHAYTDMSPENCLSSYDPHGFCVIYSSADRGSFSIAERVLQSLWTSENIVQKAVILVANKADLARSRAILSEEGKAMATAYDCKFIETSVGINHNVDELLVGLLSQIRLKLENPEKSRDLFRKRSSRRSKRRACSPLGVVAASTCLSKSTICGNPNAKTPMTANVIGGITTATLAVGSTPTSVTDFHTPPGSAHSSPRKYRGSRTSASLKVKGLLGRVWARDSKSKSCENLHVL